MRRFGYPQSFATGVIAAGGTLGAILPPSLVLAVYSLITQQDVGQTVYRRLVPGLLAALMYIATIGVIGVVAARFPAARRRAGWPERMAACAASGRSRCCSCSSSPGCMAAMFTATEAASMGAGGAFLIAVLRGRLPWRAVLLDCLLRAVRTTAAIFTILIGALLFGYFLTITQTPQHVTELLTGLGLGRYRCWC